MILKCGHVSASDTEPICPICPLHHWDPTVDPSTLPCTQISDGFPQGTFTCATCGKVSKTPHAMVEYHADGNHIHYCGCRQKLFKALLNLATFTGRRD